MTSACLRRSLCAVLLAAGALPWVVTVAIAIHEAEHHTDHTHGDSSLLLMVHGHHHDHAVQEHEHPATPRARAELRLDGQAAGFSVLDTVDPDYLLASRQRELEPPRLEPLSPSALCIWRL